MKIIALKPQLIKSNKTGAEYVKVGYLSKNGTGEIFVSKEEFDSLKFPVEKCLNEEDTLKLLSDFQTVDVEFNERGRCVGAE